MAVPDNERVLDRVEDAVEVRVCVTRGVPVYSPPGRVITLPMRVTAPLMACRRPVIVAPESTEMEVSAKMEPEKEDVEPREAEEPT